MESSGQTASHGSAAADHHRDPVRRQRFPRQSVRVHSQQRIRQRARIFLAARLSPTNETNAAGRSAGRSRRISCSFSAASRAPASARIRTTRSPLFRPQPCWPGDWTAFASAACNGGVAEDFEGTLRQQMGCAANTIDPAVLYRATGSVEPRHKTGHYGPPTSAARSPTTLPTMKTISSSSAKSIISSTTSSRFSSGCWTRTTKSSNAFAVTPDC